MFTIIFTAFQNINKLRKKKDKKTEVKNQREMIFDEYEQCLNFEKVQALLNGYFFLVFIASVFLQIMKVRNNHNQLALHKYCQIISSNRL